jgi:hypothetical protein
VTTLICTGPARLSTSRALAFGLILAAIIDKNRVSSSVE